MTTSTPWWSPERHADRRPLLLLRNRIKAAIRRSFLEQGFVEVEPGALVLSPGNETHLHAFETRLHSPIGGEAVPRYLHTSPEFACKKLLAAGETKIFTFAPCYRNGERGPLHAPEFTMLEWYRADASDDQYVAVQEDCARLLDIAARTAGTDWLRWQGRRCSTVDRPLHIGVADAIAQLIGVDLSATFLPSGTPSRDALAAELETIGWPASDDETWGDLFSKLIVEVERRYRDLDGLSLSDNGERPFLLDGYPASLSPLARQRGDDPTTALRFEVFAAGVELANGFGESNDPSGVRAALEAEMDEKARLYGERYPIDSDFIAALASMPSKTAGCALGFDRLVLLATGAAHIDQIQWTPPAP